MTNETSTDRAAQFPLANDASGNPIEMPAEAINWRIWKLAKRAGRPKVIFDAETGRPLELPITSTFDDFVEQVNESGRFRLVPVDGHGQIIPGCVAVTEVVLDDDYDSSAPSAVAVNGTAELHQLVAHLVDANTQVMKAMASAFGNVQPQPIRLEAPSQVPLAPAGGLSTNNLLETVGQISTMVQQVLGAIAVHKNGAAATPPPSPSAGV